MSTTISIDGLDAPDAPSSLRGRTQVGLGTKLVGGFQPKTPWGFGSLSTALLEPASAGNAISAQGAAISLGDIFNNISYRAGDNYAGDITTNLGDIINNYFQGIIGPEGPQGPEGPAGADGQIGQDGRIGADGPAGADGATGLAPAHEWSGTSLRFANPDGSWGSFVNLQGPAGSGSGTVLQVGYVSAISGGYLQIKALEFDTGQTTVTGDTVLARMTPMTCSVLNTNGTSGEPILKNDFVFVWQDGGGDWVCVPISGMMGCRRKAKINSPLYPSAVGETYECNAYDIFGNEISASADFGIGQRLLVRFKMFGGSSLATIAPRHQAGDIIAISYNPTTREWESDYTYFGVVNH